MAAVNVRGLAWHVSGLIRGIQSPVRGPRSNGSDLIIQLLTDSIADQAAAKSRESTNERHHCPVMLNVQVSTRIGRQNAETSQGHHGRAEPQTGSQQGTDQWADPRAPGGASITRALAGEPADDQADETRPEQHR